MSSVSTTQYYGLTQYVGSDKPSFLDNNEAFAEIDGDLHECVVGVGEQAEAISGIRATVVQLGESVTALSGDLDTEKGKIVAIQNKNQQQDLDIAGVKADALDMICALNEAAATSTHAYEIGDYFRYNDVLYKATAAIAVGETIVPNVNCAATNVSEELLNIEEVDLSALQPKEDNSLETTSKEVVGAINEINSALSANKLGTSVDITSYTSNKYECSSDGYIRIHSGDVGVEVKCTIYGSDEQGAIAMVAERQTGGDDAESAVFVRKGMKVLVGGSYSGYNTVKFIPFTT